MTADPRSTHAYRTARRTFLDAHAAARGVCDRCKHPMDYSGRGKPHRRTATVEHRYPVELFPDRAMDTAFWAAWCLSCNSAGNRNRNVPPPATTEPRTPEREW